MRNFTWNRFPIKNLLIDPLLTPIVESTYLNRPFWFEDGNDRSVTINTERYVQVFGKSWTALGRRRGDVRVLQWFQQDGATPHSSNESLAWLQQRFPHRLISRRCDPQWSPHSPDLKPQIFICGDTLRTGCMATTPRLSLTYPNTPAAPGSSFGAQFLSASETKSFCSTDLKLEMPATQAWPNVAEPLCPSK